jgi:hypothetical protein
VQDPHRDRNLRTNFSLALIRRLRDSTASRLPPVSRVDAALPFLSGAAGLLALAGLLQLQHGHWETPERNPLASVVRRGTRRRSVARGSRAHRRVVRLARARSVVACMVRYAGVRSIRACRLEQARTPDPDRDNLGD